MAKPIEDAPTQEAERLAMFRRYAYLTQQANPGLETICGLAKELLKVAEAGVSLAGAGQEVHTVVCASDGAMGWPAPDAQCARVVRTLDDLLIENDEAVLPAFFAGAALAPEQGARIGALWVRDPRRRTLSQRQKNHLRQLAWLASQGMSSEQARMRVQSLSRAATLAEVGSWEYDSRSDCAVWSEELYRMWGIKPGVRVPHVAALASCLVDPADRAWLLDRKGRDRSSERVVELINFEGEHRWLKVIVEGADVVDGVPTRMYGAHQDVTELQKSRLEVERLAFRDTLTGLPNRFLFNDRLKSEIARADRTGSHLGLIMLDLDYFKDINDSLGHDAGDQLLRAAAERMEQAYRSTDTVARIGGDEFAILLPDVNGPEDLVRPTEALMDLLRRPIEHGDDAFSITASAGAAIYPFDSSDLQQLLKNADIALYEAKSQGRNRIAAYEPSMRASVELRHTLLREVRQGVANGEFCFYYQPVIHMRPAMVSGFEALMRWNHPTQGTVGPELFRAAFEHQDLAISLCELTIESVLAQMRAWIEQGVPFGRVAINVSAAQFRTPKLAELIEARLRHWGVPPDRLTIEVTENVYLNWGSDLVSETVRRLHAVGVQIALDDFGTGYASLANLKQFPIDRLKIDKAFIQNTADEAIVRAVLTLGSSLGMEVIAEGVEDTDQLAFLTANGCENVQGFHYAQAMPAKDVPAYLRDFAGAATDEDLQVA